MRMAWRWDYRSSHDLGFESVDSNVLGITFVVGEFVMFVP